jgi:hypothetical protein
MSRIEKIMVIEPNMTRNMEENDVDFRTVLEYIQKWRWYCKEREIKIQICIKIELAYRKRQK